MYIDKLADIVKEYDNTYRITVKIGSVDVKSSSYIDFRVKKNNNKDPKFKAGDHVRILKYQNIFTKNYAPNWSEHVFVIKKVKDTVP